MAFMGRMRDNMKFYMIGLVVIPFLGLIVLEWGMDFAGLRSQQSNAVGEVNGSEITYSEFTETLRNITEAQKARTGIEPDENQLVQLREEAWTSLVNDRLIEEQVRGLEIAVTDQEIRDWVWGDNPPEDLRRSFIDSAGQFRRDVYEQFLRNPNQFMQDPEGIDPDFGKKYMVNYERGLRQRLERSKLQSLVLATLRVSPGDVLRRYNDQNRQYDASFVLFDASRLVPDSVVTVEDTDLQDYYEENLEQYRFEASRKLLYVLFPEVPSAEDTLLSQKDIEDAASKAKSGVDFLQIVYTYSERPDSGSFFDRSQLNPVMADVAFSAEVGEVVGPFRENDAFYLAKVLDTRPGQNEFVRASHILVKIEADSATARSLAQRVYREARSGADFAELARKNPGDPGSAQNGGDLGWFSKGRMVKQFEDACFKAKPGEIVGPVRSPFGYHIIKVVGREKRELKIASVRIPIKVSPQTKDDLFTRAQEFGYMAGESDFRQEAETAGYQVMESQVQEKGGMVPGIGINEAITRWAFDNSVGSVSDPFSVPSGYAVFFVSEAKDAGVRPLEEVKASIQPAVLLKKKIARAKQMAADLHAKLAPGDSLGRLASLRPDITVQRSGPFTLSGSIPGIGRDNNFLGAVEALDVGEISPPVETLRGAVLIQLVSLSPFDSLAYSSQADGIRNQLLQEKKNRYVGEWLQALKENADIVDNRHDLNLR